VGLVKEGEILNNKYMPKKAARAKAKKVQKLKPQKETFLSPHHIKVLLFGAGFILLTLVPVVGGVVLIAALIHHFKNR
jgi:hypothetical protein